MQVLQGRKVFITRPGCSSKPRFMYVANAADVVKSKSVQVF